MRFETNKFTDTAVSMWVCVCVWEYATYELHRLKDGKLFNSISVMGMNILWLQQIFFLYEICFCFASFVSSYQNDQKHFAPAKHAVTAIA